ncbi:MAG: very short patch repair endonuclease [Gammaproteobacteria bacterium]|nr:very short patch repair endonuclease [Gammaproteobacteria bacterium]MBU1601780.1 very short patch repair endonuclease [Gammaproteobacteria bacterium]MBU2432152.1 very short patch repair endonuclease [Gammaproteobacteria bacterium]MBU2450455.1 very short patch repair endonuclease [Gammaproteobacteria bacterium]
MTDVVTPAVRSRMMSGIRGKDTRPEMAVRRFLHRAGLRFRLHDRSLPGAPDLVFPRHGAVVFVHGCYWHRHEGCKYASTPASNVEFWQRKFAGNVRRDRDTVHMLIKSGWRVFILWECAFRYPEFDVMLAWLPDAIRLGSEELTEWPTHPSA